MLSTSETSAALKELQISSVPVVLASTPFNHDAALRAAEQPSLVGGGLREGVVVRSTEPRYDPAFGRLIAKYINPAYLLRRGGTDYN